MLIEYTAVMDRGPFERCAVKVALAEPLLKANLRERDLSSGQSG